MMGPAPMRSRPLELPHPEEVAETLEELKGEVVTTPVRRARFLEQLLGRPVWLKLEHQQHTGSFKLRGALACLRRIPRDTPVFTASAGNHSLAMAHASARTGHSLTICLPYTASGAKRERLAAYSAAVCDAGTTLEEASERARELARRHHGVFVSPFDDRRVIVGQGTVAAEFLGQVPELEALIIPTGGGGLLAGSVLAAARHPEPVAVVPCQPACFHPFADALTGQGTPRPPLRPSLADGLLVQVPGESLPVALCRGRVLPPVCLSEEELAAGVHSLLSWESLLVEASGAAGVAAALAGHLAGAGRQGPVGIVLTGGNISASSLAHVLTFPFRSPRLMQGLGRVGRKPREEPCFPVAAQAPAPISSLPDVRPEPRVRDLQRRLKQGVREREEFAAYCQAEELALPAEERYVFETLARLLGDLTRVLEVDAPAAPPAPEARERLERLAYQGVAFLDTAGGWQSPSYDQVGAVTFSKLGAQRSGRVNYSRYGTRSVGELEQYFLELLGYDPRQVSMLLCSSGMAAYSLIESFLVRNALWPGARVLTSPHIYFEAMEQLESLPGIQVIRAGSYAARALLDLARVHQPSVVFLDALANIGELRMVDVEQVIAGLEEVLEDECWVVVDGTMLSGAISPLAVAAGGRKVHVLYYESASKYLQLGLDLTLAGLVAIPLALDAEFRRLRRNTGGILYEHGAALLPRVGREDFFGRMRRMTEGALQLGGDLLAQEGDGARLLPVFPGLTCHPDYALARRLPHLGGVMTFRFEEEGLNHRELLSAFIEQLLLRAGRQGVPLTHGVSFGFSTPRISAAAAMSETAPPFLRLSVGDLRPVAVRALSGVFVQTLHEFLDTLGGLRDGQPGALRLPPQGARKS